MDDVVETRVIFKIFDGEVIAFLLDVDSNFGMVMSYAHYGQPGEASIEYMRECKLAKEEEYQDLLKELENIGYRVYIRERMTPSFKQKHCQI